MRAGKCALLGLATFGAACTFGDLNGLSSGGLPASDALDGSIPSRDAGHGAEGGTIASSDRYGDAIRSDKPTTWYRFEDLKDSRLAHDEMGVHDAPARPTAELDFGAEGVAGSAVHLKHKGGGFVIGDIFDYAGKSEYTVEVWMEDDEPTTEYETAFFKRVDTDSPQQGWLLFFKKSGRTIGFQFWDKGSVVAGQVSPHLGNGFHHLVSTSTLMNGAITIALYVDAKPTGSPASGVMHDEPDTDEQLVMGDNVNGRLDEAAFYDHPLSPERITAHYNAGKH